MPSSRTLAALAAASLLSPAFVPSPALAVDSATLVFDFVSDPGDVADGPDYDVTGTLPVDDGIGCDAVVAVIVDATGTVTDVDSFCLDLVMGAGGSDGDYGSFATGYLPTAGPATYAIFDLTAADLAALVGFGDSDPEYVAYVLANARFLTEGSVDVQGLESGTPFSLANSASYQCYQGKDLKNPKFVPVSDMPVADPFASAVIDVKKPYLVCAPFGGTGAAVVPALCCYKMKGPKLSAATDVQTDDGLGTLQLQLRSPKLFCTACTATPLPLPMP
jgi:hypothetical protein